MKVSKEEFEKFISEYPRPLTEHVVTFMTPMLRTYNDFTLGKYPLSIVASKDNESVYGSKIEYYINTDGGKEK